MVVGKEPICSFFSVVGEHLTQCILPALVGEAFKTNGMLLQEKKRKENWSSSFFFSCPWPNDVRTNNGVLNPL